MAAELFSGEVYRIRRKVFKLFGGAFYVYDAAGQVAAFANMKAFKLKEDIRLYSAPDNLNELLVISARQVLDISATYDVTDAATRQRIGALRRKGLKSMLKDEWAILDAQDSEIGLIKEDNLLLALLRRFVVNLLPQRFEALVSGQPAASFKQNFNPFILNLTIDFSADSGRLLDKRLGIAAGILLCAIDGRQQ